MSEVGSWLYLDFPSWWAVGAEGELGLEVTSERIRRKRVEIGKGYEENRLEKLMSEMVSDDYV